MYVCVQYWLSLYYTFIYIYITILYAFFFVNVTIYKFTDEAVEFSFLFKFKSSYTNLLRTDNETKSVKTLYN